MARFEITAENNVVLIETGKPSMVLCQLRLPNDPSGKERDSLENQIRVALALAYQAGEIARAQAIHALLST